MKIYVLRKTEAFGAALFMTAKERSGLVVHEKERQWTNRYIQIVKYHSAVESLKVLIHVTASMMFYSELHQVAIERTCTIWCDLYDILKQVKVMVETEKNEREYERVCMFDLGVRWKDLWGLSGEMGKFLFW